MLIADDKAPVRLLCRVNLEVAGMEVIEAVDGQEALERALETAPDVAVLDVMMPRLNGWQVAEQLQAQPATEGTGLVFLTAAASPEAERQAEQLGGLFVAKPFNPAELSDAVRRAADSRD